jgi:23S rRNA G2445 N2-methylase RlmL
MTDLWEVECEVLPGLESFLARELRRCFRGRVGRLVDSGRATLRFPFRGALADLLGLRTAQAAYLALSFEGRRPTALLGHQNLRTLLEGIKAVTALHPPGTFRSFRFSAAGRGTSTFGRLAEELELMSGLSHDPDTGELLIRIRPADQPSSRSSEGGWDGGWEALLRLSPRPLATRAWRVRNLPGALNATIAAAMVELTQPRPTDRFLNLLCGSGTLLAERLLRGTAAESVGLDLDAAAIESAGANLEAAGVAGQARLLEADATASGLPLNHFTALCADLPYGNLVGSHRQNALLYPKLLREAARLAVPGAAFAIITHELRLFDASLRDARPWWRLERRLRVLQGGQRPQIYVLRRP